MKGMALLVQKYGGSSVGSPERIQAVADRIVLSRNAGHQLVVVVSAMGNATDELIELAHRVSRNPPLREMDMLLTAGERVSMALLSMALSDRGVSSVSLTGSQSGIITTSSHRRARIQKIYGDRVRHALDEDRVVIVAGFQGVSESKEVTTLGRGGSDTTAVALAAALGAESCEIYTDVQGVFSADPRVVPHSRRWSTLPYDLMVEIAHRGAGVLHPRSVELARRFDVPLWVRSSFTSLDSLSIEGTKIMSGSKISDRGMEEFSVVGVSSDESKLWVDLELMRPTVVGSIWDFARQAQVAIHQPSFSEGKMRFFIDQETEAEWKKALEKLTYEGFVSKYEVSSHWVPVSVVGERFTQDGAALCQVVDSLARSSIFVTMGAASPLVITVNVPRNRAKEAVQVLHETFFQKI
jgi:aspartate kinase